MDENQVGEALEMMTGIPAFVTVLIIKIAPWKWLAGVAWKLIKGWRAKKKESDLVPSYPVLSPVTTIVNHGTSIINYGTVNYYNHPQPQER